MFGSTLTLHHLDCFWLTIHLLWFLVRLHFHIIWVCIKSIIAFSIIPFLIMKRIHLCLMFGHCSICCSKTLLHRFWIFLKNTPLPIKLHKEINFHFSKQNLFITLNSNISRSIQFLIYGWTIIQWSIFRLAFPFNIVLNDVYNTELRKSSDKFDRSALESSASFSLGCMTRKHDSISFTSEVLTSSKKLLFCAFSQDLE